MARPRLLRPVLARVGRRREVVISSALGDAEAAGVMRCAGGPPSGDLVFILCSHLLSAQCSFPSLLWGFFQVHKNENLPNTGRPINEAPCSRPDLWPSRSHSDANGFSIHADQGSIGSWSSGQCQPLLGVSRSSFVSFLLWKLWNISRLGCFFKANSPKSHHLHF